MDNINDILNNLSDDDISKLKNMAKNIFGSDMADDDAPEESSDMPNIDFSQIQHMLGAVKGDDDRTTLIKALKPMLTPARQKKADEALKLLRLFRLLPMIQSSGLLKGFLEDK